MVAEFMEFETGCVRYESMKLNNWFRDIVRMGL